MYVSANYRLIARSQPAAPRFEPRVRTLPFRCLLAAAVLAIASTGGAVGQSLEQMAGQMILVGFTGDTVDDASVAAARAEIEAGLLGGVMYLRPNVRSLPAVSAMNAAFRAASPDLAPFITLDQEGGAVERLTRAVGFAEISDARTIAARYSAEGAGRVYGDMARRVAAVGFTVNFGPVVDLDVNPDNQIIAKYGRSFGKSAASVSSYAEAFVAGHHRAGLLTSLKHFPGHGSSTADSHEGFVDITRTWSDAELDPYRTLIGQGMADMIMAGHLYHADYSGDGEQLPATLSPQWIDGVLRGELGYDGVVISDDLEMGAIRQHFAFEDVVTGAVRAGVDVLLFSNTVKPRASLAGEVRAVLVAEAERDPEFRARIEQSHARIVALKQRIGVAAPALSETPPMPRMRPANL